MADVAFDVVEQILVRSDVKDLIRFKSVCKSWQSLMSSPRFVKAHLNRSYTNDRDNNELGHRRICFMYQHCFMFYCNHMFVVGSCNGLVCLSPRDVDFLVTNPLTRQVKKLPTPPYPPHMHMIAKIRHVACLGFGYNSHVDDYKVIVGFKQIIYKTSTLFYALTLKSSTWKVIGAVKCDHDTGGSGILCDGALHWFMIDEDNKKVIISLDLSTDQFKEIPVPQPDLLYKCHHHHRLGVIENCLCIYSYRSPLNGKKWVMKNNKWELYNGHRESKYDVAHYLTESHSQKKTSYVYGHDVGTRVPSNGDYIGTSIFVKSLVSPHPHVNNNGQKRGMQSKGKKVMRELKAVPRAT